ncbi:MAG: TIGR02301 family protein [Parvibaculum sp.]|uniref:TIGR02301 family protein n=1 Tax=Parvibaculum sp. TaxID=2024848 RepID=UPI0028465CB0|nr:TIGR02301 family protein [Parvibaculum sp.]MDR3497903.1 TIGR02301 family protein [Parvibaculum sp.]
MARLLFGFETVLARALIAGALALALPTLPARAGNLDQGLDRLAEILGAAHHLRDICGANEGALWRNKMIDMLEAAHADAAARERLIEHFNNAYYRYRSLYPTCTGQAAAEANALFEEGRKLSARLAGSDVSASMF